MAVLHRVKERADQAEEATLAGAKTPGFAGARKGSAGADEGTAANATGGGIESAAVRGKLTGSLSKLTPVERNFVNELLSQGKNVEIIPRGAGKTADFLVNGVNTELKTLTAAGHNTLKNAIEEASEQDRQIIIDARNVNITPQDALSQIQRAQGNVGRL
jgi:hypothetical protein